MIQRFLNFLMNSAVLLVAAIAFVFASAAAAVHVPAKRIRNMAITETIDEL